jgi:hypothetical protein
MFLAYIYKPIIMGGCETRTPVRFLRGIMSRVINPDSTGKERARLTKAIVIAIRELARQSDPSTALRQAQDSSSGQDQIAEARDLAAFIALALQTIAEGIDVSVAAWEKRDYWIKADRFRMEWAWAGQMGERMKKAVLDEDWGNVAMISAQIAQKLQKVKVSEKHRMGTPWVGAYKQLE